METITRDKQVRGLHLREFQYSKSFYLDYTIDGKRRKVKLGELTDNFGWNEARYKAIETRSQPQDQPKPQKLNISDVWSLWRSDIGLQKKSHKHDLQMYNGVIYPYFKDKDIRTIKYSDLRSLHTDLTNNNGAYRANAILRLLRTLFNYMESVGELTPNPFPKKFRMNKENKRVRYLSKEELARLTNVLNEEAPFKPKHTTLIWLLLFTGARIGELLKANWSDLEDNVLTLTEHKTDHKGEDRKIFLSNQAMQLINNLPKDGKKIIGFTSSPQRWWMQILEQADIENFRFHDLRHTFASIAISNKATLEEVAGLLGHSSTETTKRYAHLMQDANQQNAQKNSDNISKMIMGGVQ